MMMMMMMMMYLLTYLLTYYDDDIQHFFMSYTFDKIYYISLKLLTG